MISPIRHRAPLLWIGVPFMAGLLAAYVGEAVVNIPLLAGLSALLLAGAYVLSGRPRVWGILLAVALGGMGLAYGRFCWKGVPGRAQMPPREARLVVRVERVFANEASKSSGLGKIVGTDPHLGAFVGQRVYWAADAAAPVRGAWIELVGVLAPLPARVEPMSFDDYLRKSGIRFSLRRAHFLREAREAPVYYRWCEHLHGTLSAALARGLGRHTELGGLIRAMALGERAGLSARQRDLFVRSGTMHLFAISGLHIGVIALTFELLLMLLRVPGGGRFVVGTAALWIYVDVIGAVPSAVRAFIMIFFLHAAWRWRFAGNSVAALAAAALATLLIKPEQLFSASFQLSYGIVAALLLLGVPLGAAWRERFALFRMLPEADWTRRERFLDKAWRWVLDSVAITTAATLVGVVGGVVFFGVFSPGSFLANLVLIPVASLALMAAVGAMLSGLAGVGFLTLVFNHAAALLALLMQGLVGVALKIPGMSFPAQLRWPTWGAATMGVTVGLIALGYARRWPPMGAGLWVPLLWVASVLLFGMRLGAG